MTEIMWLVGTGTVVMVGRVVVVVVAKHLGGEVIIVMSNKVPD